MSQQRPYPCRERPRGWRNIVYVEGDVCTWCTVPDGFVSRMQFIAWLEGRIQGIDEQLATRSAWTDELRARRAQLAAYLNAQRRLL